MRRFILATGPPGSCACPAAVPISPDRLHVDVAGRGPAVVLASVDGHELAAAAAALASCGQRYETFVLAVVDSAVDLDSALDAGADDVVLRSDPETVVEARVRLAERSLGARLALGAERAIAVTDPAGRLQWATPGFEELVGHTLHGLKGHDLAGVLCEAGSGAETLRSAIASAVERGFSSATLGVRTRAGLGLQHEVALSSVRGASGAVAFVVGHWRDVTERVVTEEQVRLLELELRRTEQLAVVGTLAAGVAHEINNPLTYVMANVSNVLDSLRSQGASFDVEALSDAMEGCERVRRIVADLRLISRNTSEDLEVLELEPTLESAVNIAVSELRQRARLVRDFAQVPPVRGSRARLGQVFLNLLSNAAHAIAPGDPQRNEVRLRIGLGEDGWVFVEVSDTGSGMSPAVLARVFEPFYTTKPGGVGTGLGLSLSHGIVTSLGGVLTATSAEGAGSTFRVELLPAPLSSLRPRAAGRPSVPAMATRVRVLVIDDEPQVGRAMRRTLSEHDVTVAGNAEQARSALQSDGEFDAVFCDVRLPGVSGIDLFLEPVMATEATPRARWIFMSGGTRERGLAEFLSRFDNPFLAKPYGPSEVRAALARAQALKAVEGRSPISTVPAGASSSMPPV